MLKAFFLCFREFTASSQRHTKTEWGQQWVSDKGQQGTQEKLRAGTDRQYVCMVDRIQIDSKVKVDESTGNGVSPTELAGKAANSYTSWIDRQIAWMVDRYIDSKYDRWIA